MANRFQDDFPDPPWRVSPLAPDGVQYHFDHGRRLRAEATMTGLHEVAAGIGWLLAKVREVIRFAGAGASLRPPEEAVRPLDAGC